MNCEAVDLSNNLVFNKLFFAKYRYGRYIFLQKYRYDYMSTGVDFVFAHACILLFFVTYLYLSYHEKAINVLHELA